MKILLYSVNPDHIVLTGDIRREFFIQDSPVYFLFSDGLQIEAKSNTDLTLKLRVESNPSSMYCVELLDNFDREYPANCPDATDCFRISRKTDFELLCISNKYVKACPKRSPE
jgi:hypothetical protein